jgi:DNA-3-methyladenine glycosylase
MQRKRNQTDLRKLTGGPAMLCQALGINLLQNGDDLEKTSWLAITDGEKIGKEEVLATPRIGISRGKDLPLRFVIAGTSFSSRPIGKLQSHVAMGQTE